jgi:hypothetical protein
MNSISNKINAMRKTARAHSKLLFALVPLFLYFESCHTGALLKKGPYLIYGGNNTQMCVLWQKDTTGVDTVRWGTDSTRSGGYGVSIEYGSDHQHKYIINGLTPGKKYYYQVATSDNQYAGSFVAAPDSSATSLKFIVYGDTRSNPGDHDRIAFMIDSTISTDEQYHSLLLFVGDFVLEGNNEQLLANEFFNSRYANIHQMIGNIPFQSCIGNHEKPGMLFKKYFPYPYVADRYWSFNYGPVHFTIVDQYVDCDSSSAQYRWMENDLKTATTPWKIVLLHEPGWSAGGGHKNNIQVQHIIEPLCEKYGVHLVIGGHNHYYARAMVRTATGDSIVHITTGGGGAPLYDPDVKSENIVAAMKANHYCKVNILDKSELQVDVVSSEGKVIDSFSIKLKF